jgi:hypothetical protein
MHAIVPRSLATRRHVRREPDHVGAGHDAESAVIHATHPRHQAAVVEADDQLGRHRHRPAASLDDTHDVGVGTVHRHEVDRDCHAGLGLDLRLEHQSIDPLHDTSAAVSQSPFMAYCSTGVDVGDGVISCPEAENAPSTRTKM